MMKFSLKRLRCGGEVMTAPERVKHWQKGVATTALRDIRGNDLRL
jgi:hypothetical protein